MYSVNGKTFNSYFEAISEAQKQNADVIQVDNGQTRWTPPKSVSKKKKRYYQECLNAYNAQQKIK